MFVGEAPGRDEDIAGLPFVGRSGKLLDRMLAAIGLDRTIGLHRQHRAVAAARQPHADARRKSAICLPFIQRQIELADPDVLVCLGRPSAQTLLDIKDGILKTRGRWFVYHTGTREIRAIADAASRLSAAPAAAEAPRLAGFSGDQEGAGEQAD